MSERVDTAALLGQVREFIARYVLLPGDAYRDVMALWVLHAHVIGAADNSPRLIFKSPEKESGKTRALEVLEVLVPAPLATINATVAAVFRLLAVEQATLLFDEVDAVFNPKMQRENEDLRALLNAGYRRFANVIRVVGEGKKMKVERFPVFAAKALAAIGDLPDTVESRSIIVPMRRRAPDEHVDSFRRRKVEAEASEIRDQLDQWAVWSVNLLATAEPHLPEGVTDRAADIWEPLLAIGELAGKEWAKRAREAASFVVKGRVAQDLSLGVRLLVDIKAVMGDRDRRPTEILLERLNALEESPWGGWNDGKGMNPRDLAKRLKPYGIEPKVIKLADDKTARGYMRGDFADAWSRYLRDASATDVTDVTPTRIDVTEVTEVADTGESRSAPLVFRNGTARLVQVDDNGLIAWRPLMPKSWVWATPGLFISVDAAKAWAAEKDVAVEVVAP